MKRTGKLRIDLIIVLSILLMIIPMPAHAEEESTDSTSYYLGSSVNAGKDTGYSEDHTIGKDDIHYGWRLGQFRVSDYTRIVSDEGTPIFLKNVGDKVMLSFNLQQDINKLDDDANVTIDSDQNGYDQRLGVPQQDFGRGTLIIRYTDYQNNRHEPTVYTSYLNGISKGADTAVTTFEEGDYEVALDYSIKNVDHGRVPGINIEILPGVTDYTMRTKFRVRNGNCMVYPFDVKTGAELSNAAFTENGFRLDLARSRYLDIDVKREILADNDRGLVSDTRFNKPARDGEEFTDEGVYTFTVKNRYTGQSTSKMIYVGTNPVLKAHAKTGKSVSDIQALVAAGATIRKDGTIDQADNTNDKSQSVGKGSLAAKNEDGHSSVVLVVGAVSVALLFVATVRRRNRRKPETNANGSHNEE